MTGHPRRAWINAPSKDNVYHNYHGMRCIAIVEHARYSQPMATVYFTEGVVHSMMIEPKYLSECKLSPADNNRKAFT